MPRRIFVSLILRVVGNVNSDAGIGTRIPLKKIITWKQEIRPFVSARSIRRSIRERLYEKGFEIDPLMLIGRQEKQLGDIGNPILYVDDDLFGFLKPQETPLRRSAPIKISHLISLRHSEIKVEFATRFARDFLPKYEKGYPVPFEIELADWIGKLDIIISDRIGRFYEDELTDDIKTAALKDNKLNCDQQKGLCQLTPEERYRRLKAFLEILLWEGWSFPKGSQSPSVPEYYYAAIVQTDRFVPFFGYIDITDEGKLNEDLISKFKALYDKFFGKLILIDYKNGSYIQYVKDKADPIKGDLKSSDIEKLIEELCCYTVPDYDVCKKRQER